MYLSIISRIRLRSREFIVTVRAGNIRRVIIARREREDGEKDKEPKKHEKIFEKLAWGCFNVSLNKKIKLPISRLFSVDMKYNL